MKQRKPDTLRKDEVASNFSREVGMNNLKLISGKVEDTLVVESNLPEKISILEAGYRLV